VSLAKSKIVPTAFWVGFLALGFVTSVGAPAKHRVEHASRAVKALQADEAVVAQSEKPSQLELKAAARD
jgi:hypothetical protein